MKLRALSVALLIVSLFTNTVRSAEAPGWLQFDVDFEQGCKPDDRFDPAIAKSVNTLKSKPAVGKEPFRKFSDIRNSLNGKQGAWKAAITNGAPFTSPFLRFDVPANTPLAGRFELFQVPTGDAKGDWFVQFDYARLSAGKGAPELLVVEIKNRWGSMIAAPAIWYSAWLGDWKNVKSNRDLPLGKVVRIRLELDLDGGAYTWRIDGAVAETGKINPTEFGGVSFVFGGKTAKEALAFGLDNLQVGRVITGPQVTVRGEIPRGEGKASNLFFGEEVLGANAAPLNMVLKFANRYPKTEARGTVAFELFNERGRVATLDKLAFVIAPGAVQTNALPVCPPDFGWYSVRARLDGAPDPVEVGTFCVIRKPTVGLRPDSFFGLGIRARGETPEDVDAAERMGVKWKRGLDLNYVYPGKVRSAPDRWWGDAMKQSAISNAIAWNQAGVSILGYIDYNMPWNAMREADGKLRQAHRSPPADLVAHAEMVESLVSTLKDYVKNWELWNEPGGFFWGGTSEQYREMLRVVYERLKPKYPDVNLIGGGHYMWISRDWVFLPNHDNAGYVDGMALHPYGRPGLGTPISASWDAALIRRDSKGKGKGGLWATELGTLPHWLFTMHDKSLWPWLYARSIAPTYLLNKLGAGGTDIKIFWFFSDYGAGQSENTNFWTQKNPTPAVAAYAAMTHFLEDGKLLGDLLVGSKRGWALHFIKPDGTSVVALWPETPWPAEPFLKADLHESDWTLPALDFEAYDFLGRKLDATKGDRLTLRLRTQEVVFLSSKRPADEVRAAMQQVTFSGLDALRVNPQPFTQRLTDKPALRIKVRNDALLPLDVALTLEPPAEITLAQTRMDISQLAPGETREVEFAVARATPRPDNRYRFGFRAESGDYRVTGAQDVQVACASYGTPVVDGDLSDWADATFVSIRHVGPLADWWQVRPSMTVGEGYRLATRWDDAFFYVAATIPDQTSKLDTTEPKTDQEKMEYRNRGNDRLNLGFNVIEKNPDDLLLGHPLYDKSLANDIDYEFSAELQPGPTAAEPTAILNRRLYPGSRFVTSNRPEFTPVLGPMNTAANEGRVSIRYGTAAQSYTYELAIAWSEIPELKARLAALKPGETTAAAFGFLVTDGHKWNSQTRWCEELGDIEFGAYGFDRRVGTPCWLNDYSTRLQSLWGFTR